MRVDIINTKQTEELIELGYDFGLTVPNVDMIIDLLRKDHNIIIHHKMEPFVSPTLNKIIYCFSVKWCNLRDGWNGRKYIGQSEYGHDIYELKREAITIAINYLKEKRNERINNNPGGQ